MTVGSENLPRHRASLILLRLDSSHVMAPRKRVLCTACSLGNLFYTGLWARGFHTITVLGQVLPAFATWESPSLGQASRFYCIYLAFPANA